MSESASAPTTAALLAGLAAKVSQLEGRRPVEGDERVSTACAALDALLPDGGLRRGTLVEWVAARPGSGAATLALLMAREASRQGGAVVVVDRQRSFYPPAAIRWGLELEQLIVARPGAAADEQWACDQVLRSRGVAALVAWPERLGDRAFRRLQLAAETSGTLGLLIRPATARDEPSWADLRVLVEPVARADPEGSPADTARRLRMEILRARGGAAGRTIHVILEEQSGTIHAEASTMPVAAPLADRTARRRSTGA